jgi:hypothetical protein
VTEALGEVHLLIFRFRTEVILLGLPAGAAAEEESQQKKPSEPLSARELRCGIFVIHCRYRHLIFLAAADSSKGHIEDTKCGRGRSHGGCDGTVY